ncbi:MAG TPA: AAA family ATPase, partial [Bacteroidales bacterium]|nr:AAA family ATPase [Bacteroidales bacterium]
MPQSIQTERSYGKLPVEKAWVMSIRLLDWLDDQHSKGLSSLVFYPGILHWDASGSSMTIAEVKIFDQAADLPSPYIAPEETGRIAALPDYRSDYYRLGIIWYELFTGQPPFTGSDPVHVVWQHLAENPAAPVIVNPQIGVALSAIIMKLLAKNQAERYQSADSIRHDWEKAFALYDQGNVSEIFELGTTDFPKHFSFPDELIGRDEEMAEAMDCVKALSQQPRRGLLWIEGEEGSGKSFFIRQLENKIKQDNPIVLSSNFRDDGTLPYNSIKLVFEQLCVMLLNGPEATKERLKLQLEEVLGTNVNVLTDFVPLWGELLSKSQSAPSLGAQETQNRLAYVLISVLAAFAKPGQSMNLVIEDIHLAPPQTLRLLTILLDEPQLRYCLFILTARDNTPASAELNTWLENVMSNKGLELRRIRFGALHADAIARFFARSSFDNEIISELAEIVVRKTGGVPFFIRQLMETASSSGCLLPDAGKKIWTVNQRSFAALDIT